MKKITVITLIIVIISIMLVGCQQDINSGEKNVLYKEIVYERSNFPNFGLSISEEHASYIGDFYETYDYGQQLPWEVYVLNSDENVLYSAHAVWIKPGYVFPGEFGEEFSSVQYAVCEGIDFLVMEDEHTEKLTLLATFEKSVKLEDIIETTPSDISEYTEHDYIRFEYKNHADMSLYYKLCSSDGQYYLNVRQGTEGTNALFKIKAEYVDVLTYALLNEK